MLTVAFVISFAYLGKLSFLNKYLNTGDKHLCLFSNFSQFWRHSHNYDQAANGFRIYCHEASAYPKPNRTTQIRITSLWKILFASPSTHLNFSPKQGKAVSIPSHYPLSDSFPLEIPSFNLSILVADAVVNQQGIRVTQQNNVRAITILNEESTRDFRLWIAPKIKCCLLSITTGFEKEFGAQAGSKIRWPQQGSTIAPLRTHNQ